MSAKTKGTLCKEIRQRHRLDRKEASAVSDIVREPLDLPSLERQLWHNRTVGDEPFLSDGYQFKDKPHRIVDRAISEIRALRKAVIEARKGGAE